MKSKISIPVVLILMAALSIPASAQTEGNQEVFIYGLAQTFDDFKTANSGARVGFQSCIDEEKGVWLRATFGKIDFGPEKLTTVAPGGMIDWYMGKQWKVWFTVDMQMYLEGPLEGIDLATGLGVSRRVATLNKDWAIPPTLKMWGEVAWVDGDSDAFGSMTELKVGLSFNRGKRQ